MRIPFAASCIALLALAACGPKVTEPPPGSQQAEVEPLPPEVRVGLLLPLSGAAAPLGQDMLDAAQMALFDVGENDIVLLPRDTGGTPDGARQAAEQLIDEGAEVILGPLFSQAVVAVRPVAAQAGIRLLAFSNDAKVAGDGAFLLGFRPEEQVRRVVDFALAQNLVRIAGLAPDDAYGATALTALRQAVQAGGGELGATLYYPPQQADLSAVGRRIAADDQRQAALEKEKERLAALDDEESKRALEELETLDTFGELPFDAILIADGSDRLRSVASLLNFFDIDPTLARYLGTMRWQDDPRVLEEAALQGGWYAGPPPASVAAFRNRFEGIFGRPPELLAALAYDATALAVIVVRDLGDRSFAPATLTNAEGFAGATGLFRLRPDGLAEHALAVLQVAQGTAEVIDPAPRSFVLAAR